MNYRSILIVCLATLGLAVAGWGQAVTSSGEEAWIAGDIRRLTDASGEDWSPSWSRGNPPLHLIPFLFSCVSPPFPSIRQQSATRWPEPTSDPGW